MRSDHRVSDGQAGCVFIDLGVKGKLKHPLEQKSGLAAGKNAEVTRSVPLTWMVALLPSSRMISPISLSCPTLMSSYIAAPPMLSATTTGPDTFRTYLLRNRQRMLAYSLFYQMVLLDHLRLFTHNGPCMGADKSLLARKSSAVTPNFALLNRRLCSSCSALHR